MDEGSVYLLFNRIPSEKDFSNINTILDCNDERLCATERHFRREEFGYLQD